MGKGRERERERELKEKKIESAALEWSRDS